MNKNDLLSSARSVIDIELSAIEQLKQSLDDSFVRACEIMLNTDGHVIVVGMGKSGHIGKKIAATLASTGTPAFFVHPAEANHGDLGMVRGQDVMLAISNSGNTPEVTNILPLIKRLGTQLISMTGNTGSLLAEQSDVHLHIKIEQEACSLGLAPTASTTAAMVMGDALAVALLGARGFTEADFAFSHPGGSLGKKLLVRVDSLMHKGDRFPSVAPTTLISDALMEISTKGLGMTTVVSENGNLLGLYTDGDLRRSLNAGVDIRSTAIEKEMSTQPTTVRDTTLASKAAKMMQDRSINGLVVLDHTGKPVGALNMQDLLRAGIA